MNQEQLTQLIRQRTENYYEAHRLCCSEAIMHVINQGLGGGLPADVVVRIGSGFCGGMGGGEGACGALTGAVTILGLMIGPNQKGGLSKKKMRNATKDLHDRFQERYKSICCNDITHEHKNNRKGKVKHCKSVTGAGAELVAEIILKHRPDLTQTADIPFLSTHDSKIKAMAQKLCSSF